MSINSKNRLILVHAGSSEGFIPGAELIYKASSSVGDYHGQMNYQNFEKWILEKLIPNLPPNSVICMDNAPYHTKKADNVPTKYAVKSVMIDWLTQKGIPINQTMRKAELFSLITKNSPTSVKYKIDEILIQHGHEVVRLPPYHCDLNAIEYVWSSVKRFIKENNVTGDLSLNNLQSLVLKSLNNVTAEEWKKNCKHVEHVENMYWEKDGVLEEVVDNLIIELHSSESESETDSDDCFYNSDTDIEDTYA